MSKKLTARRTTTDEYGDKFTLVATHTPGGAYVEVHFDGAEVPFEVINVYDYAKGECTLKGGRGALSRALIEWIATRRRERREDGDQPGAWLGDYLRNC